MAPEKTLEAVLKITERCNIDCTYCYVFNKGDESYKLHPPYMPSQVVSDVASYFAEAVTKQGFQLVAIDFHGGEPLMMKKERFTAMCDEFLARIPTTARVRFSLQTNAILVSEEWIDIFEKYQISIGVSLDGPQEINDTHRVDHKGRGTYNATVQGLKRLQAAALEGRIPGVGLLSVAQPHFSGREAFRHFVHDLGVSNFDFLLPIDPVAAINPIDVEGYGRFLCDAFDAWVANGNHHVYVRIFQRTMAFIADGRKVSSVSRAQREGSYDIVTIASNGDVGPDDSIRTLGGDFFDGFNVASSTLNDFQSAEIQTSLRAAESSLPTDCEPCCWKHHCRGGASNGRIINRFTPQTGFDNASAICGGLKQFFSHVAAHMLRTGTRFTTLQDSLDIADSGLDQYAAACDFSSGGKFSTSRRRTIPIAMSA